MKLVRAEAELEILPDKVMKTFNSVYFQRNEYYQRLGALNILKNYQSKYFISPLEFIGDNAVVLERFGHCLGKTDNFNRGLLSLTDSSSLKQWLFGLKDELKRLGLRHRDLHPGNIVTDGKDFKLIDFAWVCEYNRLDSPIDGAVNTSFGKDDEVAITTLVYEIDRFLEHEKNNRHIVEDAINAVGTEGYKDGSSLGPGWLYHHVPFHGWEHVKIHKGSCVKEEKIVRDYIERNIEDHSSLLDIGCSNGYFIFKLQDVFEKITGVERDRLVLNVAEKFKELYGVENVNFFDGASFDFNAITPVDVTLLLNTHMWIHKQLGEEKTKEYMKSLRQKTKHLFFQTSHAESGGMYRVSSLKDKNDIVEYLREAGFSSVRELNASTEHGGVRYLFYAT